MGRGRDWGLVLVDLHPLASRGEQVATLARRAELVVVRETQGVGGGWPRDWLRSRWAGGRDGPRGSSAPVWDSRRVHTDRSAASWTSLVQVTPWRPTGAQGDLDRNGSTFDRALRLLTSTQVGGLAS